MWECEGARWLEEGDDFSGGWTAQIKITERQSRKLTFKAADVPDCTEIKKKWVVIAFSIDFKGSKIQLLRKGLNNTLILLTQYLEKEINALVKQSNTGLPAT